MAWFSFTAVSDGNVAQASDLNTPLTNAANGTVTVPHGGTGLTAGTSGGLPYFSATTTIASTTNGAANSILTHNGTAPSFSGSPTIGAEDARTNTVVRNVTLQATTSGTPAAGIGTGLLVQAESADENPANLGALDFVLSDVGAGTEDSYLSIPLRVAGRALDEKYRFTSTAGDGFTAIFAHAVTADRTYTLPDATGNVGILTGLSSLQFVRKTSDETVNSSSTLQNDDVLLAALAANEVVEFAAVVHHVGNGTADFKLAFTVPAAATILWNLVGAHFDTTDAATMTSAVAASGTALSVGGSTDIKTAHVRGIVVNGANAGNLQLQWAQASSTAVDTIVKANSYLLVRRV